MGEGEKGGGPCPPGKKEETKEETKEKKYTEEKEAAFGRILKSSRFLLEKRKRSKENQCQRPEGPLA